MTKLEPENQKTKVVNKSKSKAPELQILKRSEPNKKFLKKTESESQKPRFQRQVGCIGVFISLQSSSLNFFRSSFVYLD